MVTERTPPIDEEVKPLLLHRLEEFIHLPRHPFDAGPHVGHVTAGSRCGNTHRINDGQPDSMLFVVGQENLAIAIDR